MVMTVVSMKTLIFKSFNSYLYTYLLYSRYLPPIFNSLQIYLEITKIYEKINSNILIASHINSYHSKRSRFYYKNLQGISRESGRVNENKMNRNKNYPVSFLYNDRIIQLNGTSVKRTLNFSP